MESKLFYVSLPKKGKAVVSIETEKREVAYGVILPAFGEFFVVKSANAWWMDTRKVSLLFDGFKAGGTDESACINAGISIGQLRYFREAHPDFLQAKQACKSAPLNKFLNALHERGPEDLPTIRWYLSKVHPDFQTVKEKVDPTPVVQQTVNIAGDAAVINHVDTTKIEELLARAAEQFFSNGAGEGVDARDSGQGVAQDSESSGVRVLY